MKHILFLLLLLPLVAHSMDYTKLRTRLANDSEYWFRWDGDSWTSDLQVETATGSWASDYYNTDCDIYLEAGGTPWTKWKAKRCIWADPTTTHSTYGASQLAYRLGVTGWYVEAIGGATIGEPAANGAQFSHGGYDNIIEWTHDDRGDANKIDLMILYGGINDLHGSLTWTADSLRYTFDEMARRQRSWVQEALKTYPRADVLMLTHQPCAFNYFSLKKTTSGTGTGYDLWTWERVFSEAMLADSLQDSLEVWMMGTDSTNYGSLRADLFNAGYDTTRVFAYNLRDALRASPDSVFSSTGVYQWCADSLTENSVDTTGFYRLDIVPPVLDADKLHMNALGKRRKGDLVFRDVFGGVSRPNPARNRTLYVDVDNGDNWDNRGYETEKTRPLRTLQAAIFRAFPGDSIVVTGSPQNLSDLTADGQFSLRNYDLAPVRSNLRINFASDGLYYRGYPGAYEAAVIDPHFADSTMELASGVSWLGENYFMAGDTTWDFTVTNPFQSDPDSITMSLGWGFAEETMDTLNYYWLQDMDWTIYGLDLQGYTKPFEVQNVTDITFKNSTFSGTASTGTASYTVMSRGRPVHLYYDNCTFYTDSVLTGNTGLFTLDNYPGAGGASNRFYSDSMRTYIDFKDCDFIGDADVYTERPLFNGFIDGLTFRGCTITDQNFYREVFTGNSFYELAADSSDVQPNPFKMINCKVDIAAPNASYLRFMDDWIDEDPGDADECVDSLIVVNNLIKLVGAGSAATTRFFNGTYIDSAGADIRNNFVYTEDAGGADPAANSGYTALEVTGGAFTAVYMGGSLDNYGFCFNNDASGVSSIFSTDNDSLLYWGATTWDGGDLDADYGITHGDYHASRGPVQYTERPNVILGTSYSSGAAYAQQNLYGAAQLITSGIYPACDSLDTSTWLKVQIPTSAAEQAQIDLLIQMYDDLPEATKRDLKLRFVN